MQLDYTTILLGLPEFCVKNSWDLGWAYGIRVIKKNEFEICPSCWHATNKVHDKREQRIRDIPIRGKATILFLLKRRFRCNTCFKVFIEKYESIEFYGRMTIRFKRYIGSQYRLPFKWVAEDNFVSQHTVTKNFKELADREISQRKPEIITALGIDENSFKKGSKYSMVFTDILKRKTLDIVYGRSKKNADKFLLNHPYKDLIHYVVIDMYKPYLKATREHCPKAFVVVDKFHVLRYALVALGSVRKKKLNKKLGIKITRKLVLKPYKELKGKQKEAIDYLLENNPRYKEAYEFKEKFLKFYHLEDIKKAENELIELIAAAMQSSITKLNEFARMLMRWWPYVLNYFIDNLTNGFTEGMNNKIKTIKKSSYGFRNHDNFRRKVLMLCA